jgi:hypothetical protein
VLGLGLVLVLVLVLGLGLGLGLRALDHQPQDAVSASASSNQHAAALSAFRGPMRDGGSGVFVVSVGQGGWRRVPAIPDGYFRVEN